MKNTFHSKVIGNNCSFNYIGIDLYNSANITISNNTVNDNRYCGIELSFSYNNTILNNTVNKNEEFGILLDYSNNNTICINTVNENDYEGISIFGYYNRIFKNVLSNNRYGLDITKFVNNITENKMIGCGVLIRGTLTIWDKIDT